MNTKAAIDSIVEPRSLSEVACLSYLIRRILCICDYLPSCLIYVIPLTSEGHEPSTQETRPYTWQLYSLVPLFKIYRFPVNRDLVYNYLMGQVSGVIHGFSLATLASYIPAQSSYILHLVHITNNTTINSHVKRKSNHRRRRSFRIVSCSYRARARG